MSNWLGKIFGKGGEEAVKTIAETIDGLSTSDQEKAEAKEKLTNAVMTNLVAALQAQRDVIISETQGNWLQRSWRPILMLAFGFIIFYTYFLSQVFALPSIELPEAFWSLLELGIGGYVIGRTVEKTADTVMKNVDISFIKKKNREVK